MGRVILVAVDSSPQSQATALWAVNNLAHDGDSVHLAVVAPPPAYSMTPAAPIASAGAVRGTAGKGLGAECGEAPGWWRMQEANPALTLPGPCLAGGACRWRRCPSTVREQGADPASLGLRGLPRVAGGVSGSSGRTAPLLRHA